MNHRSVPIIYTILTGLASLAAVICFYILYRQLAMLYGAHTVSTGIVIVSGLLSMALGSFIGGKIADKQVRPLEVFIAFSLMTGLFFLFCPFILKGISILYLRINEFRNPGPLRAGIFKLLFSLAFLILPAGFTAGSLPLLIRHFIKQVSYSGRFMNAGILSSSIAVIAGLSVSAFLLVPWFGLRVTMNCGAMVYLVAASVSIVFLVRGHKLVQKGSISQQNESARVSSIRFRKKKNVLETGMKLKRATLKVFAIQGFTMASLLLLSFRILINYNLLRPSFFYVLTIIIFFTGIATGSAFYNRFAERPANKYITLATLQIITGFGALLSYSILKMFSESFTHSFNESPSFTHVMLVQSALYLSFLLIPSVLIGLSLPLAGRLYPKRLQHTGNIFGYLGTILYLSLALGCVVTVMVLIPLMGLQITYFLLAILITISGIYLIFKDSRLIRGFRVGYALSVLILLVVTFGAFRFLIHKEKEPADEEKVEGITASAIAGESPDHTRAVYINGQYAFGADKNSLKAEQFAAIIPVLLNQHINAALVAGFGTGITSLKLEEYGVKSIHVADIYPEIIKLSSEVFADDNDDIMTDSHVEISSEDPRSYLMRSAHQIDLITAGLDLLFKIPGIHNSEFYQLCYNKLTDQGILCQVLPVTGINETEFASILKSCTNVFASTSLWYITPEHVLLVASKGELDLGYCRLSSSFSAMNADASLTNLHLPDVETLLAHILTMDKKPGKRFAGAPENSNNHPFVEYNPGMLTGPGEVLPWLLKNPADYSKIIDFKDRCEAASDPGVIRKIRFIHQSLLQHVSFSSSKPKWNAVDFFEQTGAPFQRYL